MLIVQLVLSLVMMLLLVKTPLVRAFLLKTTWPIRWLLPTIGFVLLYSSFILLKLADPRAADVFAAGLVKDKLNPCFIRRTTLTWRLVFYLKSEFIVSFIPHVRAEGFFSTFFSKPKDCQDARKLRWQSKLLHLLQKFK